MVLEMSQGNAWLPCKYYSPEGTHGSPGKEVVFITIGAPQFRPTFSEHRLTVPPTWPLHPLLNLRVLSGL